ncbi:hypothetical protein FQR65_LT09961 [Abscondita terminalis]|nr:hypothetical protein FQR65_LT09961 [Abscondita terminalis]
MLTLLLALACVFSASYQMTLKETHPDFYERIQKYTDDCISESKANAGDVEEMFDKGEFPNNKQELKCFMKCILEKTDILNGDGEVQKSGIKAALPEDSDAKKAEEIIDNCMKVKSDDPCETAYEFIKCCKDIFD